MAIAVGNVHFHTHTHTRRAGKISLKIEFDCSRGYRGWGKGFSRLGCWHTKNSTGTPLAEWTRSDFVLAID